MVYLYCDNLSICFHKLPNASWNHTYQAPKHFSNNITLFSLRPYSLFASSAKRPAARSMLSFVIGCHSFTCIISTDADYVKHVLKARSRFGRCSHRLIHMAGLTAIFPSSHIPLGSASENAPSKSTITHFPLDSTTVLVNHIV